MDIQRLPAPIEQVQSDFDALVQKLAQLPGDCQAQLTPELNRLRASLEATVMALRASEEKARTYLAKYNALFGAFPQGISVTDEEGHVVETNLEAERLLGVSTADHTARRIDGPEWQIVRSDGSPMPPEEFASTRSMKTKQRVENVEMGIRKPDGELTWINVSATPIPLEGYGVVITYGDITARKLAEQQLQAVLAEVAASAIEAAAAAKAAASAAKEASEERKRLLAVMEALPVGVAIVDQLGRNLHSNQAFEQIWGGPRPQANSISDYYAYKAWWVDTGQIVQPDEWASARAVQNGETITGQFMRIQRFDGTQGFILNSGAPILDDQGQVTGCAVAIQDITDRVQAEQALSLANSRFQTLLENLPVGVVLTDPAGNFLITNPANRELFGSGGVTGDASGPSSGYTLRHPDGSPISPEELPLMSALKEGASIQDFEFIIRRESGEEVSVLSNISPVRGTDGSIQGAVAAMQDITRLKQAEIQQRLLEFREKERLEIARDLHDGPVQDLIGLLFNIQFAKEVVADRAIQLEFEQVGLGVQGVVRDLREVCNALRPPSLIRFGLSRAILVHAEEFRERHPEQQLLLDLFDDANQVPEQTSLALYRIYQEAMNNIVRHAHASCIHIVLGLEDGQVILQITDNGDGFTVPGSLAEQTRSGHFGMAGMKERADLIGGSLRITSTPGKGTTVRVRVDQR
jgi:PAS domain S-box-containing protein